jgi:hypothetical protein
MTIEVRNKKMTGYIYLHKYASIYGQFEDEVLIAIVIFFSYDAPKFLEAETNKEKEIIPTIGMLRAEFTDNQVLIVKNIKRTTIGILASGLFSKFNLTFYYVDPKDETIHSPRSIHNRGARRQL